MDYENGLLYISTGKTGEVRSRKITDEIRVVLAKPPRICEFVFTRNGLRLSKTKYGVLLKDFNQVICQERLDDSFSEAELRLPLPQKWWQPLFPVCLPQPLKHQNHIRYLWEVGGEGCGG